MSLGTRSHFRLLFCVLFVLVSVARLMTKTIISQSISSSHMKPTREAPEIYLMNIVCAFLSPCESSFAQILLRVNCFDTDLSFFRVFFFFFFLTSLSFWDFYLSNKAGGGRADERQSGGWTLLFHPMNHHWEKEVKD